VADAHRDQRGADAPAQREGASAVSLDETPREEELPASERFADDGPTPEQVFASTEIREMISENLDELSPLLRTAVLSCAKCRAIRQARQPRSWASRKTP